MSRMPRAGGPYVTPIDVAASVALTPDAIVYLTNESPRGFYTLASGSTYVYEVGGPDAPYISASIAWDASIIITSITVEDCDWPAVDVSPFATSNQDWFDEDPAAAFIATKGAGVTNTNGVISVAGGAVGGCRYNIEQTGAMRTRFIVVVGGTGGKLRFASHGKE